MVALVVVNLLWIVFDALFANALIQRLCLQHWPTLYYVYSPIHLNFFLYDLFFVALFLSEFFVRWGLSVWRREYYKWFFYPFVHWYDLIGSLPLGALRWLRFLRVWVVLLRLKKLGLIEPEQWTISKWLRTYYEAFVEELSDRIVVNVLRETQNEIRGGHPVSNDIITRVIHPHLAQLLQVVGQHTQHSAAENYRIHRPQIENYIRQLVRRSTGTNADLNLVQRFPVLGQLATQRLEQAIADIMCAMVENAVHDFEQIPSFEPLEPHVKNYLQGRDTAAQTQFEQLSAQIIIQSIDLIIARASRQRWKEKLEAEKARK